jgi:hypothetical protein
MNGRKKASMASFQGESKSGAGVGLGLSVGSVMAVKIVRTGARGQYLVAQGLRAGRMGFASR